MSVIPCLQSGESVVLYDGVCKLCNGWVHFLLRHNLSRKVRFAAVQSDAGKMLLDWAGLPQENITTIVFIEHDRHTFRAQAVCRVMRYLPLPWRVLSVLRFCPDAVSNFAYDRIALNRYRLFGRYDALHTITPDYPDRFLHQAEKKPATVR